MYKVWFGSANAIFGPWEYGSLDDLAHHMPRWGKIQEIYFRYRGKYRPVTGASFARVGRIISQLQMEQRQKT